MITTVMTGSGEALPFANVFQSSADGLIIAGGFYAATDANGQVEIPDTPGYITFSFVGLGRATYPAGAIPETVTLDSDNTLETVTVTASPTFPWSTAILIAAAAIVIIGGLYIYKPSIFKFKF